MHDVQITVGGETITIPGDQFQAFWNELQKNSSALQSNGDARECYAALQRVNQSLKGSAVQ